MKKNNDNTTKAQISIAKSGRQGWAKGTAEAAGKSYEFLARVYDGPAPHGIEGGRIPKLWLLDGGKVVAGYNSTRGWTVRPCDGPGKAALEALLARLN